MRVLLLAYQRGGLSPQPRRSPGVTGRSLSEGFINLDEALLRPCQIANALQTNSNG
jgi:hypothetical protein